MMDGDDDDDSHSLYAPVAWLPPSITNTQPSSPLLLSPSAVLHPVSCLCLPMVLDLSMTDCGIDIRTQELKTAVPNRAGNVRKLSPIAKFVQVILYIQVK